MNDIDRLQGIYGAAGRELRQSLRAINPANYSDIRAAAASTKAKEIARVLNVAAERWASEAIPRAYAKSVRVSKTALEILGRKPRRKTYDDRRRRLIDDLSVILIRANGSIPKIVERYLAAAALASKVVKTTQVREFQYAEASEDIERIAADAMKKELSRGTLSSQVRDYLYDLIEDDQFIEIGGRMYRMKKYADLIARTTLREAQTAATIDLCHDYENDLVQWSDHATECELCKPFEGRIYSISGRSSEYPPLEEEPPIHPNCEHSLLPTSEEAIAVREERA